MRENEEDQPVEGPVSPDPTGFALGTIMIVNAILALNVLLFSREALGHI